LKLNNNDNNNNPLYYIAVRTLRQGADTQDSCTYMIQVTSVGSQAKSQFLSLYVCIDVLMY